VPRLVPCLSVAAGAAIALALPASAGAFVQIDRGIAGARLGNTPAQVRQAIGPPAQRRFGTNDFGPWLEYRYLGGIQVFFQGRNVVTSVSTTGPGDRTIRGIGVGSTELAVRRNVRGVRCESFGGLRSCHTGRFRPGERVTDFTIRKGRVSRVLVGFVID
jgi:hypothetical protein